MFVLQAVALLAAQSATPVVAEQPAPQPPVAPAAGPDQPVDPYQAMLAASRRVRDVHYDDSDGQQRRMAATDRSASLFFSRPGATPAVYQDEWQLCRRVARWLASDPSQFPSSAAVQLNSFAFGGGMLGAGLAAGFSERITRRNYRRQCLLARGWRMVEPDQAGRARIEAMSRNDRNAYFDRMLGAEDVSGEGHVSTWSNGVAPSGAADDDD